MTNPLTEDVIRRASLEAAALSAGTADSSRWRAKDYDAAIAAIDELYRQQVDRLRQAISDYNSRI